MVIYIVMIYTFAIDDIVKVGIWDSFWHECSMNYSSMNEL